MTDTAEMLKLNTITWMHKIGTHSCQSPNKAGL